jgi:hypothetical protein
LSALPLAHHLIVAHEVTNIGNDRSQLANMAEQAREATGIEKLAVVAYRISVAKKSSLATTPASLHTFPSH